MTTDPYRPIGPPDADLVAHLTAKLGPPNAYTFGRSGSLDLVVQAAWKVGFGQILVGSDDPSTAHRGTDVEILLTEGGRFVVTRRSWTQHPQGSEDSQRSQVCVAPYEVLQWLVADGDERLGPASKAAWIQACQTVPAMAGLEFEHVD